MKGLGLTYQTFAGTFRCHMAGDGTWKTLGREQKNLQIGVQKAKSSICAPALMMSPLCLAGEPGLPQAARVS